MCPYVLQPNKALEKPIVISAADLNIYIHVYIYLNISTYITHDLLAMYVFTY
jgi:hypothetical protein